MSELETRTGGSMDIVAETKQLLEKNHERIVAAMGNARNATDAANRLSVAVILEMRKRPELQKCSKISILQSVMESCSIGLSPVGPMQYAYLIPYWNRALNCTDAQLQIGYRGFVELARRSGAVVSINADVVRQGDFFEFEKGEKITIKHRPSFSEGEQPVIAAYAVANLVAGGVEAEVMPRWRVDKIMERARGKRREGATTPWDTDFEQMAIKTVVKLLCKRLPKSHEFAKAIEIDERADDTSALVDASLRAASSAERLQVEAEALDSIDRFQG
jgi:recombination protein RecT